MKKLVVCCLLTVLVGCGSSQGSADTSIKLYARDASSGTREAFEKAIDLEDKLSKDVFTVDSNGDMATKVKTDANGIGYVSFATDFEANELKPLSFEGVEPTTQTVLDKTYQMQRPFSYVTRAKGDFESDKKQQLVEALIDYMQNSTEGMQVVENAGGVVDLSKSTPWAELKKKHPIVNEDNTAITITTAGSTSVEKTMKAVLEAFQAEAGQFQFKMNQSGSSDGYKRVLGSEKDGPNKADIGFASREFKKEEDITSALASGVYCLDGVVIVVNKNNALTSLTKQQAFDIFSGAITNWNDVK